MPTFLFSWQGWKKRDGSIGLEAGPEREWSESGLVVGSHLIQPCATAYSSALHYWAITDQVPRTAFVQSTARKHQPENEILGVLYRFVTVVKAKFFAVAQDLVGGQPIRITHREKAIVDAARMHDDRPPGPR